MPGKEDSAIVYYAKSIQLETENTKKSIYFKKIIFLYERKKDYMKVLRWNTLYCLNQNHPSNMDYINWGLAAYKAKNYFLSDSIFVFYRIQHPGEEYGYYWQARSKAAIDSTMKMGLAVPVYKLLVDLAEQDVANVSTRHEIEALSYLAAYYSTIKNDTRTAKLYDEKLLQLDPGNEDARQYLHPIKNK